jgi:hypothetical protein
MNDSPSAGEPTNEKKLALSNPPRRPFWTPPRVAAIPCLLSGILWTVGGLLPAKITHFPEASAITQTVSVPAASTQAAKEAPKDLMQDFGPFLRKYGVKTCEIKAGHVEATVDLKLLLNALGWTVIALGSLPNAFSNFAIGKNTRQPSIWACGLTWLINTPILLFSASPASLAFSNIALGLLVAGAADQVQNTKLKPGEEPFELNMERVTSLRVLLRSLVSPHEMKLTLIEVGNVGRFVWKDLSLVGLAFRNVVTQSYGFLTGKRKQAPVFIAGFMGIEPVPEQKRIIAGLFGLAAAIALPAMFMAPTEHWAFMNADLLTKVALETMGIAGFFDAVTVFQQSCEFKVDPSSRGERIHKWTIVVAVAMKGLTDLVSFLAVSDLFLGIKFLILGSSLSEFWNKVDKDGQFWGWMEDNFRRISQTVQEDPTAARAALAEVDTRAKASKEWRKLQVYLQENAKHCPGMQELMTAHA